MSEEEVAIQAPGNRVFMCAGGKSGFFVLSTIMLIGYQVKNASVRATKRTLRCTRPATVRWLIVTNYRFECVLPYCFLYDFDCHTCFFIADSLPYFLCD